MEEFARIDGTDVALPTSEGQNTEDPVRRAS
jgi:hypothetical protein